MSCGSDLRTNATNPGIGEALARALAQRGWRLGLAARRLDRLQLIAESIAPTPCLVRRIDLAAPDQASNELSDVINELGAVDLCIVCAGTGYLNRDLDWNLERETIEVNALGFAAAANVAAKHFIARGEGRLIGVTSVMAARGSPAAPAYAATKAFMSIYLDGLRASMRERAPKTRVTEVAPGFVDTTMMKAKKPFWVATADQAAASILRAIDRDAKHAYITPRWAIIGALMRLMPRP